MQPTNFIIYQLDLNIANLPYIRTYLAAKKSGASILPLSQSEITERLLNEDKERCDLNPYPPVMLTDPSLGHWDLHWPDGAKPAGDWYEEVALDGNYKGRDPARDIRDATVCIDFGTAGTVVASRDNSGEVSLLRVGALGAKGRQNIEPSHYVNPTVLSILHSEKLLDAWRDIPYRPSIRWLDAKSSHQAKNELTGRVRHSFYDIETWAKGKTADEPRILVDERDKELRIPIPPASSENDIAVDFATLPLNPIELYAYYIGLALNNQADNGGRIFTEYCMTFPAGFDRETRDRILDGFRRGLMRSLPPSLVYGSKWNAAKFKVIERASEPAALAAALLPLLKDESESGADAKIIEPTKEGVAFGVFDFGGGTTDFAIGLYRLPTEEEEEGKGGEKVVDILDNAGDPSLGGE
ncbi:MAG: hypothetical protein K2H64_09460, partial [Desulfovibrio sp.]|nr:hypothetical protein [Desulfovibrio sp.]